MKRSDQWEAIASAALAITMIAAILLLVFGVRLAMRPDDRQRGLLMIACGIIFIVNVLIWTLISGGTVSVDLTHLPSPEDHRIGQLGSRR